jgi:SSS family solute:Na+ symporter
LDIFKKKIDVNASETKLVNTGKIVVVVSMLIGVVIAPHLGIDKGGFDYIQEYTGFVSPGIFAMFILGFFWKKANSEAALFATIGGFIFSVILKFLPRWADLKFMSGMGFSTPVTQDNGSILYEIPFLDRMGFVFIICIVAMYIISMYGYKKGKATKGLEIDRTMFKVNPAFAVGSLIIIGLLAALYTVFW